MSSIKFHKSTGVRFESMKTTIHEQNVAKEWESPAMAYYKGVTYCLYKQAAKSDCNYVTIDSSGTVSNFADAGVFSRATPQPVVHNGKLLIVYRPDETQTKSPYQFHYAVWDKSSRKFTNPVGVASYEAFVNVDQILGAISYKEFLYVFGSYLAADIPLVRAYVQDPFGNWTSWDVPWAVAPIVHSLGVAVQKDRLVLMYNTNSEYFYITKYDGFTWTYPVFVETNTYEGTGPGIAVHRNVLQAIHRQRGSAQALITTHDGNAWSPTRSCANEDDFVFTGSPALAHDLQTGTLYTATRSG